MGELKFEIKAYRILKNHIDITKELPESFSVSVQTNCTPKKISDSENKVLFLPVDLTVAADDPSVFSITLSAEFILRSTIAISDVDKKISDRCMKLVVEKLSDIIDQELSFMQCMKLEIAKHIKT